MSRVWMLTLAFLREHPFRILLTSLATIAATALVVWVASSYDALLNSFETYSDESQGRYTLSIAPISTFSQYAPGAVPSTAIKYIPPEVVGQMSADPAVLAVDAFWAQRIPARMVKEARSGPPPEARPAQASDAKKPAQPSPASIFPPRAVSEVRLIGTTSSEPPYPMTDGRWMDPTQPDILEGVLSSAMAEQMNLSVGDVLIVGNKDRAREIRIVGLTKNPVPEGFGAGIAAAQVMSPALSGLYVPMALASRLQGEPSLINYLGVLVNETADVNRFRYSWTPRLGGFSTPLQFQEAYEIEENLDQSASAENMRIQSYASTVVALLAALFLVFSTLNMGVGERIRQFAILRAVIFTKWQVGALIAIESFLLATIGFVGGLGAGIVAVRIGAKMASQVFRGNPIALGSNGILLAAVCSYGGALLAAIIPAWRAMRVKPLEAMSPPVAPSVSHRTLPLLIGGLILMAIPALITFRIPMEDAHRFPIFLGVGYPAMALAFILIAPAIVVLADRFVSPILAQIFRLPTRLLASQVTAHLWRTSGIALALSIGLGLYIAVQVWGFSMLNSFVPGAWAPDAIIALPTEGLSQEGVDQIAKLSGIDSEHCLPIVFEQPRMLKDLTRSAEHATVTRQDTVVIVGIDAARAFAGDDPLFSFEWVDHSPETAIPLITSGRGCIVPDHFLRETGLKVGDSFELVPPENPAKPASYVIAGAVRMLGWHWQTKPVGFRSRTHRAAALIFADYQTVSNDFQKPLASHIWFNYSAGMTPDREELQKEAGAIVTANSLTPPSTPSRVIPVMAIRDIVNNHARQWLWAMSRMPIMVLAITCIGILNALIASVRARRWEIGVLRAIGFTRWDIVRVVVAEGLLIGIVACVISLSFGILAGWCGAGISQYTSFFGGLRPSLVFEWGMIALGLGIALLLCTLAAIGPAISISRVKPLELLQQGRGSF